MLLASTAWVVSAATSSATAVKCVGEFMPCSSGTVCSMSGDCGTCKTGQYLCPSDQKTCIGGPQEYGTCPGIKGTHLDDTLNIEARIDYILKHMTTEEQIAQLWDQAPAIEHLGIPEYEWLNDDVHGVARTTQKATVLPNGCGLGATWSRDILERAGLVLGREARALHNYFLHNESYRGVHPRCNGCGLTIYGPNLNLVKDPRWGRGQETFGEDPFLTGRLVVSWITGAQNNSVGQAVGPDGKSLLSGLCCKHFAAYDEETQPVQKTEFDAKLSSQSMWETYMPAFEACIKEARATHVMCSYNSVNGVPTCGNNGLLNQILRDQWLSEKFDGFVVSDYDAWADIMTTHHYAKDFEDAAAIGLNNGMDQEGGGHRVIDNISSAIAAGKTTAVHVATALRRLFRVRIRLGMLDPPLSVGYNLLNTSVVLSEEHLQVALEAALAAMTLLKNERPRTAAAAAATTATAPESTAASASASASASAATGAKSVLPLDASAFKTSSLAVIGPQAIIPGLLLGNYAESGRKGNWGTSILDGIKGDFVDGARVQWATGCANINCADEDGFAEAAALASQPNVSAVVVTLGLGFNGIGGGGAAGAEGDESEGHDRTVIELPGKQAALVAALREAAPNKPIVGVLVHGGTLALGAAGEDLDAILSAWYPGIRGANAIAQTLFGVSNPAGRTASTWYKSTSVLPLMQYEMDESAGKGVTYRYFKDYKNGVVYPFGYGLSYTSFVYSNLTVSSSSVVPGAKLRVAVIVKNTGSMDGEEVVQVYAKLPDASVPTTRVRLVAFERVRIAKGAEARVTLQVRQDSYALVRNSSDVYTDSRYIEKGRLELHVGGGQPDYTKTLTTTVTVTQTRKLREVAF